MEQNGVSGASLGLPHYSYTINVSPKKYVKGSRFDRFSYETQKRIISDILVESISKIKYESYSYVFEDTKQGLPHIHGSIFCTKDNIVHLQSLIHSKLGFPSVSPNIVFMYEATKRSRSHWISYMNKDQVEIDDDGHPVINQPLFISLARS